MHILGIGVGHDAAACLLADGEIVAMAAEERFSRIKHDAGFPAAAIAACLAAAGLEAGDLDVVAIAGSQLPLGQERHLRLSPEQRAVIAAARPRAQRVAQVYLGDQLGELPLTVEPLALAPSCRLTHVDHHRCHAADSGLALGAALQVWHGEGNRPPRPLEHLAYGPAFGDAAVREVLEARRLAYRPTADPAGEAARLLADGRIVGWFQGRMEAGPRALGNRSILMSPLAAANRDVLNARVKFREGFRPFCPSIAAEHAAAYLEGGRAEDFMITSFRVAPDKRERIPAAEHVDGTLRPQTVRREVNPPYHALLEGFGRLTGVPAVLNTSFNVKGEPIVCHPRDAIRCFFDTGLDALVIGGFVLEKPGPPADRSAHPTPAGGSRP